MVVKLLCDAIRSASIFNPDVQVAPTCILWPDHDRQWESVIPELQKHLPELLALDDYNSEKRTGPAIWLRCAVARTLADLKLPAGLPPILYLPGISRQDLRAIESCPDLLKPLAEMQYRGVIWSQVNAKDWTILAFLKSDQGGIGLDVAQDTETKNAMQLALPRLLEESIEGLRAKGHLDKDYFNSLLTGGDPVRELLQWLNDEEAFRSGRSPAEWQAFVALCKSQVAFDPASQGALSAAVKLAARDGAWAQVWGRYCEAPQRYPNIPAQIRKTAPPQDLFSDKSGWPQWNEEREGSLRAELKALHDQPAHEARKRIAALEKEHAERRKLVWADLGEAPLARALEHLAVLAEVTTHGLTAGAIVDLAAGYQATGWRADDAVLRALECVEHQDVDAVAAVIRAIYLPWAEDAARHLQQVADQSGYPELVMSSSPQGEVVLFVDGLRFDVARRLAILLAAKKCVIEEQSYWAALPTVTATGKPAVTAVREKIGGLDANVDFEAVVAATGQSLKGGSQLKKLMEEAGWAVLGRAEHGTTQGFAWSETGDIDHLGHDQGWKLAKALDASLKEVVDRIEQLLAAGWQSVRIVTDHGWLLLPGGLPKTELASALTENKWGRCAVLKPGATTSERLYPWHWNQNISFVLANGVSCFRKGEEYAHGGLSLQECLLLDLRVTRQQSTSGASVAFADVSWKGLRCTVTLKGACQGLSLDLRRQPGNPASSQVTPKPFKADGTTSVIVENEDLQGSATAVVVTDKNGNLVAQCMTLIGGP